MIFVVMVKERNMGMANCENCIKSDVCKYYEPKSTVACERYSEPVHHGHWITQEGWTPDDYYYTCSICNEDFYMIVGTPSDNNYKFCPHCGAKMDKED